MTKIKDFHFFSFVDIICNQNLLFHDNVFPKLRALHPAKSPRIRYTHLPVGMLLRSSERRIPFLEDMTLVDIVSNCIEARMNTCSWCNITGSLK